MINDSDYQKMLKYPTMAYQLMALSNSAMGGLDVEDQYKPKMGEEGQWPIDTLKSTLQECLYNDLFTSKGRLP